MSKVKVYELAKELEIPSKEIVTFLDSKKIEVKSHMSNIEDDAVALVREKYVKKPKVEKKMQEKPVEEKVTEEKTTEEHIKKKASISAVYNPQHSKMVAEQKHPQGDRPQGDRPQGSRPQGDRPQG
ncbi:MAG: translation initiation factor IF-2 N-terminal domain-containing protein, partial [Lachnospiraceae bacterium]